MSKTTFSGPVKAGTNNANVGQALMAQTFATTLFVPQGDTGITDVVIPANSQIVDIILDAEVGNLGSALDFSVGDTVGGAATFINDFTIGNSSVGRLYPTTESGGTLAWVNIGPVDKKLTWRKTGAGSGGKVRVTVWYQQNNNLTA